MHRAPCCPTAGDRKKIVTQILDQAALIGHIVATLRRSAPRRRYGAYDPALVPVEPATFAMVVGAGFSYGAVPLVQPLMCEWIGDYYYPDQDMSSLERPVAVRRRDSADFWKEFNTAATRAGLPPVELDKRKLPIDCAAAYNTLFAYDAANLLFANVHASHAVGGRWLRGMLPKARQPAAPLSTEALTLGSRFVRGFLRYVLAPGCEHGDGVTGRGGMNAAHLKLAAILAAQQTGGLQALRPFCRTVFTTNFDSLLQAALASEKVLPIISDRPERGFDPAMFEPEIGPVHIVHVHGSVLRDNPASSAEELAGIERANASTLAAYLASRDVLVIGHSGWNDALVAALAAGDTEHTLYWCDVAKEPNTRVARLLEQRRSPSVFVRLDPGGADALMTSLHDAMLSTCRPRSQREARRG